ncbi:MAG TPA: hypothetical protein VFF69_12460 [Phycisphaerales bacterium]|nr:hypothetical protein [Phycisphaerales bacterium]
MPKAQHSPALPSESPPPGRAMRAVPALALLALTGCSDPEPGLTSEQFYSRAGATRERILGPASDNWDALAEVIKRHESISNAASEAALNRSADPDTWPALQVSAICLGPLPRPGLENGLALVADLDAAGVFDELDSVLAAGTAIPPWDAGVPVLESFNGAFARTADVRDAAESVRAHIRLAALEGNSDAVVQGFRAQLALARVIANRCLSFDYLMGVARLTAALRDARHLALEEALTPEMLRGILSLLDGRPLLPPIDAVLDTERDFALATFVDSAKAAGYGVSHRESIARIEAAHAAAAAQLAEPGRGRVSPMSDEQFFGAVLDGVTGADESLDLLDQSFASVLDNERRLRFDLAGTRAVLLVAFHRAEHGRYPETLAEVGAPLDPIAGMPFAFHATPEEPGAPFLLYSVGADRTDNGGLERRGGVLSAPSPDDEGFDCRFTTPRRSHEEGE